ncbi:hypothetical protein EDL99_05355 [Ornithobacterium rhinotracheale]|uniref:hypothetical protein n=1 Tax=Ornithobacterium rhinotracheale TaxID=28251 RepID=UPI00129CF6B5|nr:hypothetical protein [Ornithobacterium rhinotracheale]MRJ08304.1 hypothetical protein [Ornithobacterium rhinotracheale]UOH77499.1 hypothetical protein MT996_09840 [Ornithobacterium rhinotracheale]
MLKKWNFISLIFFFIIALLGTYLRSFMHLPLVLEYKNLVHAHSHVAFQGWLYLASFVLLTKMYLTPQAYQNGKYALQFKLTLLVVVGILISFALQGYALYSIIFSTLFQLLNYWFIYRFIKDTCCKDKTKSTSLKFMYTGLFFNLVSSIFPFFIGFVAAKKSISHEIYNALVYGFLHFQYNAWFMFTAIGLFVKSLENKKIRIHANLWQKFYVLMLVSVVPAVALSMGGMSFFPSIQFIAYAASALQILAEIYLIMILLKVLPEFISKTNSYTNYFWTTFLICSLLKISIQSVSVLPWLKSLAFVEKNLILSYLHLCFIGVLSASFLASLIEQKFLSINLWLKIGAGIGFLGFFITELIMFLGGFHIFYSHNMMIIGSVLMSLCILIFLINAIEIILKSNDDAFLK